MGSPYDTLSASALWRSGVAEVDPLAIDGVYLPKFPVTPDTKIMTAGSCFAQHVHRALAARNWAVIDVETPQGPIPRAVLNRYGYGLYSARYGNIYTARQMLQLLREALGEIRPAEPIWTRDGRYFDAQRPNAEPLGLESAEHVMEARSVHLRRVLRAVKRAEVFVFTLGLTEVWRHKESGTVYPTAPGTLAGHFDPEVYGFHNFTLPEVRKDLEALRTRLKALRPDLKMLLTVSPVPLTATATDKHVLVSTSYSKAVLRGAAGEMAAKYEDVDYFPSFELITNPAAGGRFYKNNLRSVTEEGVTAAMRMFFQAHAPDASATDGPTQDRFEDDADEADLICEEALIEAARS
ncbi:GSCFA domain-containing protein [Celeribacter halophilus]|uniref:GSCFA family protein n=1 Tax=Celeribacter halophilus TaxID=576117 RepID=A0A1I3MK69_9RHOB|nr:GSCFA domain-containing protein [Celeribacter halophilus]PZX15403.1 GSCFA family protein [Celeribacter halophilus]SFI97066.1 GSCFA family protein [Celeribacter halophilus]